MTDIFQGAGFDDEAAALRAFWDLNESKRSAKDHLIKKAALLSLHDMTEMTDYLIALSIEGRKLLDVGFVALCHPKHGMMGFAIYHRMSHQSKNILHIRQAASMIKGTGAAQQRFSLYSQHLNPGNGFISTLIKFLVDRYPDSIYEANQRAGNRVKTKEVAEQRNIIRRGEAVLGYNKDYYFSFRANHSGLKLLTDYLIQKNGTLIPQNGKYYEAEDVPRTFFKISSLDVDVEKLDPKAGLLITSHRP